MKSLVKSSILLLCIISYNLVKAQHNVLTNSVPKDLRQYTLLVKRFKALDPNDKYFKTGEVNAKKQKKFIQKHNNNITKNNIKLKKIFNKHYNYKFKLVNENSTLDTVLYPYIFGRTLIVATKGKNIKNGFFSFSHNIHNRKRNKTSRDINLYSRKYWQNIKIIIYEMNDYLETI